MHIIAGILLLIVGVIYPMVMMFWLNRHMSRQPALPPRQIGWILAFNWAFPVTLIVLGLGLLSSRLWGLPGFRLVVLLAAGVSFVLLIGIWRELAGARKERGKHGRGTTDSDL